MEPTRTVAPQVCKSPTSPDLGVTFRVGEIVTTYEGAWNQGVILGFEIWKSMNTIMFEDGPRTIDRVEAVIFRPYVYAHHLGTDRASPLVGQEVYRAPLNSLRKVGRGDRQFILASDFVAADVR